MCCQELNIKENKADKQKHFSLESNLMLSDFAQKLHDEFQILPPLKLGKLFYSVIKCSKTHFQLMIEACDPLKGLKEFPNLIYLTIPFVRPSLLQSETHIFQKGRFSRCVISKYFAINMGNYMWGLWFEGKEMID